MTWAQVAGLDCCHDSLDLGISVAHFDLSAERLDFEPLLACIRGHVNEPLTIRCFGVDQATILVRDDRGKLRKVGWIGRRAAWRVWQRRLPTQEAVIRFSDTDPPPVTAPSGVDDWFGADGRSA